MKRVRLARSIEYCRDVKKENEKLVFKCINSVVVIEIILARVISLL